MIVINNFKVYSSENLSKRHMTKQAPSTLITINLSPSISRKTITPIIPKISKLIQKRPKISKLKIAKSPLTDTKKRAKQCGISL